MDEHLLEVKNLKVSFKIGKKKQWIMLLFHWTGER